MNVIEQSSDSTDLPVNNLQQLSIPGINPDHTVPLELLENDLTVEITDSEDIAANDFLVLSVGEEEFGSRYYVTDADKQSAENDPAFRYLLTVSKQHFPAEGHSVALLLDYFVNDKLSGRPLEVILDREPPGGATLPYLSFTNEQLDGISQSDLTGSALLVRAPFWYGKKAGDVITPWLGTSEEEGTLLEDDAITVKEVSDPVVVPFSKAKLLSNGDVTQYFAYKLRDALGNESDVSRSRAIDVSLTQSRPKKQKRALKSMSSAILMDADILELPGLIPPRETLPDGTLPIFLLNAPIAIKIPNEVPEFPSEGVIQLMRVEGDGEMTPIGAPREITEEESEDPDFEFELSIPVSDFPPKGTTRPWLLSFSVYDPLGGGTGFSDHPKRIIFDQEAPGGKESIDLPMLEFTPEQLSGITLADVVGDSIPVPLAAWYLAAAGDIVELWLGTSNVDGQYLTETFTLGEDGKGLTVQFKVADIAPLGNNTLHFGYRLIDKAGNVSPRSQTTAIAVLLTDPPSDLKAPVVPDYLDHGVITRKDAAELVEVEIPNFTNAAAGDNLYLFWGSTRLGPFPLTASDINPDPDAILKEIKIPYATVLAEGSGKAKQVQYEVWRGALLANTSPPTTVDVDLSGPGPDPDPDPLTPWHENLIPLTVTSASGAKNEIPPADFNTAATALISHLGKDSKVIWQQNDYVQISWDGILVPDRPVAINQAAVNQDLTITIPAETVSASTGIKNVFYIVSRDLPSGQTATAEAEVTLVNVQSPGQLPGNGALAVAIFPEEIRNLNIINRTDPGGGVGGLDGTPVRVPLVNVGNVGVGDRINLRFVGRKSMSKPDAPEIPDTEYVVSEYRITQQDLNRGYYQIDLAYNPYLQKICRNGSTLNYSITNAAGTVEATQKFIRIALGIPGNILFCPINP